MQFERKVKRNICFPSIWEKYCKFIHFLLNQSLLIYVVHLHFFVFQESSEPYDSKGLGFWSQGAPHIKKKNYVTTSYPGHGVKETAGIPNLPRNCDPLSTTKVRKQNLPNVLLRAVNNGTWVKAQQFRLSKEFVVLNQPLPLNLQIALLLFFDCKTEYSFLWTIHFCFPVSHSQQVQPFFIYRSEKGFLLDTFALF